jgi:hypothetical protein
MKDRMQPEVAVSSGGWQIVVRTESGIHTLDVQATGMAAGMYRVALQTKEGVVSRTLMIAE